MKKSKAIYENYLNEVYGSDYSGLEFLTNKSRGKHCSMKQLQKAANENTLGTLLRKLDPIAFNCGLNDCK